MTSGGITGNRSPGSSSLNFGGSGRSICSAFTDRPWFVNSPVRQSSVTDWYATLVRCEDQVPIPNSSTRPTWTLFKIKFIRKNIYIFSIVTYGSFIVVWCRVDPVNNVQIRSIGKIDTNYRDDLFDVFSLVDFLTHPSTDKSDLNFHPIRSNSYLPI